MTATRTEPRTTRPTRDADPPPESATPPPGTVVAAFWLALASTAAAITSNILELLDGLRGHGGVAAIKDLLIAISFIATFVFFAQMMRTGRRWGRTTLALFAAIGLAFNTLGMLKIAGRPISTPSQLTLSHISNATAVLGVVLMYVPASQTYFRLVGDKARLISPRLRKLLLAVHVTVSVGWMGIIAAMEAMAVNGSLSGEHAVQVSAFSMLALMDAVYLGLVSLFAVLTGIVGATGTKWHLMHRRWIVTKLVVTVFVMSLGFGVNHQLIARANHLLDSGASPGAVSSVGWQLVAFGGTGMALLAFAAVVSTYKPWGLTKYGRRKQAESRPRGRAATTNPA